MHKKSFIISIIFFTFILNTFVFGASMDYRLMHNDQDVLLIGEIIENDDDFITIKAHDYIVSSAYDMGEPREQLRPEIVKVKITPLFDSFLLDTSVGTYVLASLNKIDDYYVCQNGIYNTTSLNKETLKVEPNFSVLEAAAITDFVNSDGQYAEFSYTLDNVYRRINGELVPLDITLEEVEEYAVGSKFASRIQSIDEAMGSDKNIVIDELVIDDVVIDNSSSNKKIKLIYLFVNICLIITIIYLLLTRHKNKR